MAAVHSSLYGSVETCSASRGWTSEIVHGWEDNTSSCEQHLMKPLAWFLTLMLLKKDRGAEKASQSKVMHSLFRMYDFKCVHHLQKYLYYLYGDFQTHLWICYWLHFTAYYIFQRSCSLTNNVLLLTDGEGHMNFGLPKSFISNLVIL